jgi:endonuclease/exonuclease/phosphatase family metal-dependent hydrolase
VITVASYNIRKGIGTDRRRDPFRTIDVLHEIDADVIALQEADRRFGAKQSALPLDWLTEHSDYKWVPFDIRPGGIGWHGNAILVRKSAEILSHAALPLPMLEPRGAVMAEIRIHGEAIRVVGMHLDLSGLWRARQAQAVIDHIASRGDTMPTVLMGDLNEWTVDGGALRAFSGHYQLAPTGRSFHSRRPMACLDRILLCPTLEVVACGVHRSARASRASDHLPIWAKLART